jgi:hypothetical protein
MGLFPEEGVKRSGREADQSYPSSADINKTWIYTSTASDALKKIAQVKIQTEALVKFILMIE